MFKNNILISFLLIIGSLFFANKGYSSESVKYKLTPGILKGSFRLFIEPHKWGDAIPEMCLFTDVEMGMSMRLKPNKRNGKYTCSVSIDGVDFTEGTYTIHVIYSNKEIEFVKISVPQF